MRRGPSWLLVVALVLVGGCCASSLLYALLGRHPPPATAVTPATPVPTTFRYPSPTPRPYPTPSPTPALTLALTEALASGQITVTAHGAGLEAVLVTMQRLSDVSMAISIPVGTFFVNRGEAQDMVSVVPVTVYLNDSQVITSVVKCACANLHRPVPGTKSVFDIAVSPAQEELARLITAIEKAQPNHVIKQVAVWVVTDDVSRAVLDERYVRRTVFTLFGGTPAASDDDVAQAIFLIKRAGIDLSTKTIYTERISLLRALGSDDTETRRETAALLGLGEQEVIPYLIATLDDQAPRVRGAAAYALGKRGDERAILPLSHLLEDEDPIVRQEAIRALTNLHAVDVFVTTLASPDLNLRMYAVQALCEIGDKRAVPALIETLDDQDPRVRTAVAACLGKMGDPRAITALNAQLEREQNPDVVEAIRGALAAFEQRQ